MKIPQDILLILEQCTVEGNTLFLPDIQLEHKVYQTVNKCLENIGGKWNRKEKGHIFDDDPTEALENLILTGETTDTKKLFQFFPTPRTVAEQMVEMADIKPNSIVLEPSIGKGDLADVIYEHGATDIFGIELNADMKKHLDGKPYTTVTGLDFLEFAEEARQGLVKRHYSHVIMNPPFAKQQDIDHIMAAYDTLVPGGTLVSVATTSWRWRDNKKAAQFREWLNGLDYEVVDVPEGAFKESGTMIATVIIKIKKEGVLEDKVIEPTIPEQPSPKPDNGGFSMISNISIEKIIAHPNNPRKNLGDLTELVDSIKAAGILQNLTVVPVDVEDYKRKKASKKAYTGEYITIIGHRRAAASRLAGLVEVPCAVVDMDEKTQVATMLLENMQRSDLTVYEQAQGMQLMLDLGETTASIAEKTGFSQSTVRRRVKLMELDREKVKEAEERGATLMDYAELDKINDIDLKNEVLDSIGTNNFRWKLSNAIEKEERAVKQKAVIEILETFAIKMEDKEGFDAEYISAYSYDGFEPPEDAGEVQYYYCISGTDLYLLVEDKEDDEDNEDENTEVNAREERKIKIAELGKLHKQAHKLRMDFAKAVSIAGDKKEEIMKMAAINMTVGHSNHIDEKDFATFFDIKGGFKPTYGAKDDDDRETFNEARERIFAHGEFNDSHGKNKNHWSKTWSCSQMLFAAVYLRMENNSAGYYISNEWSDNGGCHQENKTLDKLYNFLCSLGYKMSDEEKALQDGSHELYTSNEKIDEEDTE